MPVTILVQHLCTQAIHTMAFCHQTIPVLEEHGCCKAATTADKLATSIRLALCRVELDTVNPHCRQLHPQKALALLMAEHLTLTTYTPWQQHLAIPGRSAV